LSAEEPDKMTVEDENAPALGSSPPADHESLFRKFGKQIQKRQLEVPEYAASFVNYKALKKVPYPRFLRRENFADQKLTMF
jgi:hypothetical protein